MAMEDNDAKPETSPNTIVPTTSTPNDVVSEPIQKLQQQQQQQPLNPRDFILSVASKIASQPLHNTPDPHVWGVLTAISNNARKRTQGINILLTADEHCIGRLVEDVRFQIDSNSVSANHCKIYRMRVTNENMEDTMSIFLKDTSTNGTYLNWEKLKKNSAAVKVHHGDIISFSAPPQHELAFAFVYREAAVSTPTTDNAVPKRKAEEFVSENKRLKGLGIGAPEGPISLDDFRSLQRSNTELRKQLENKVVLIDTLRNENRAAVELHENELKSVKESVAKGYLDQLKELQLVVDLKHKELGEANKASAEQKHALEDLNERLSAYMQSCAEANAIINSQKVNITELKEQLDEEKTKRKEEQEKAADDLKAAVHRAQTEAQEEVKRLSDAASRREREQQETINKLQESERESSSLVETLRSKLEDTRQKLVVSDNKVRQLETQLHEEQMASANGQKRVEELELETKSLKKELESEKQVAREEAWAKVSVLELEINAAMRDLDFERRRLKGARERLMLRETQLRSFYSTTAEIQVLFAKQQEQLKSMQRTLEDEDNYDSTSVDVDGAMDGTSPREKQNAAKAGSANSGQKLNRDQVETSSDEASVTEKHDCDGRSEECQNTQEAEFTSADHENGVRDGVGSNIDGVGTAPMIEGDAICTEQVVETESPANCGDRNFDLNRNDALAGDTMQLDDDVNVLETEDHDQTTTRQVLHHSQSNNHVDTQKTVEDTQGRDTIQTADLLTSEVAGSWACSTAPSVHEDNESPSRDNSAGSGPLHDSNSMVAKRQITPPSDADGARKTDEQKPQSETIGNVATDSRGKSGASASEQIKNLVALFNSETESCSDTGDDDIADAKHGSISDTETQGGEHDEEDQKEDDIDSMDEDDEDTQEDSVG
ncbi:hypothetical protein PIB30_048450 [Stylosanthes scabra]|uniref:FHA domain-containing protein n=1 Tax=Stylosanthes scabra TaxID=79078 RepID=A0ABU6WGZ3_9FABA|nr:hypothetical protein [Stylosanthes scabra]